MAIKLIFSRCPQGSTRKESLKALILSIVNVFLKELIPRYQAVFRQSAVNQIKVSKVKSDLSKFKFKLCEPHFPNFPHESKTVVRLNYYSLKCVCFLPFYASYSFQGV